MSVETKGHELLKANKNDKLVRKEQGYRFGISNASCLEPENLRTTKEFKASRSGHRYDF